ncbi:nitroreductase family protein, partial [bacterium]|nr:nitroreductase family protein [bacterium]
AGGRPLHYTRLDDPANQGSLQAQLPADLARLRPAGLVMTAPGDWRGEANRLSDDHDPWPTVDAAFRCTEKPDAPASPVGGGERGDRPAPPPKAGPAAERVIRSRRSAQRMDGKTHMSATAFFHALAATLPMAGGPWRAFPWPPRLALFLFVHRVEGLEPGRYALIRDGGALERLRAAGDPDDLWRPVAAAQGLPLFLLRAEPADKLASQLSCLQAIAGKGAFAATMIADFARTLDEEGDWAYRRLHWEAGLLGQVLYLEATAAGLAGTGIGCFFDDAVKAALGIDETAMAWQPVYNFTVGGGGEGVRILTLPAYDRDRT